jgi:hypothetical protein
LTRLECSAANSALPEIRLHALRLRPQQIKSVVATPRAEQTWGHAQFPQAAKDMGFATAGLAWSDADMRMLFQFVGRDVRDAAENASRSGLQHPTQIYRTVEHERTRGLAAGLAWLIGAETLQIKETLWDVFAAENLMIAMSVHPHRLARSDQPDHVIASLGDVPAFAATDGWIVGLRHRVTPLK